MTSTKSEEEEKEALSESRRALEVAKARISRPVYFVLYRFTGFQGASIHLLINRWSQLSPLYQGQGFSAWVRNCIQAPRSACSTKIMCDSCRVFLEYIKMEHINKVTKIQDNVNDVKRLQTIWMSRFFFQAGICKASLKSVSVSSPASDDPADIHSFEPNYYNILERSLTPPSVWRCRLTIFILFQAPIV